MSDITKSYRTKYLICKLMSIVMLLGPLTYYLIVGMSVAEPTKRVILAFSTIAAILLTFVRFNLACILVIKFCAVFICLKSFWRQEPSALFRFAQRSNVI